MLQQGGLQGLTNQRDKSKVFAVESEEEAMEIAGNSIGSACRFPMRLLLAVVGITASLAAAPALAQAKQTIEQCANGSTGNVDCTGNAWVTGSLNSSKSRYREGDFVPFRVIIDGLTNGNDYTLRIGYDAVEGGLHAYDYLGSYNASRRPGQSIVPCNGIAQTSGQHACGNSPSTLDVPTDTNTFFPSGSQQRGEFSAWGARLTSASYVTPSRIDSTTTGTVERRIDLTFTAQGPVAVLAWGGHVASILNWGPGRTFAQAGSGAPFHMRLLANASFNPGNQDLSLHTEAIAPRPAPFSTSVNVASVELGGTVIDTAHLGGSPRPTGTVRFFVCFGSAGPPDCTLGGDLAGHGEVLAAAGTNGISSIVFRPEEVGFYCFRAAYEPSDTALFSPATHTNLTTECFQVTAPPTRLTVTKLCVPSTDSGRFNLLIDGVVHLPDARCSESTDPIDVQPGIPHTVSETAGTGTNLADYESAIGGDCAADGTVTLALGQSATCTITNVRPGTPTAELTVIKECVPADDTGRFDVLINSALFPDLQCGQSTGPIELAVGAHQVTEAAGTNTSLAHYTTVIGGNCSADGSITLSAGESATCTITNRLRPARLTITKLCVPAADSGKFRLEINGQGVGRPVRCGGTRAVNVSPGKHHVGERGVSGTDLGKYDRVVGGDCDANGVVEVAPAESATCTITNVRRPEESKVAELTVLKVCAPSTDGGRFNLRIDGVTDQDVSCGGRLGPVALLPGTHRVGESSAVDSELSAYTTVIGGACKAKGSIKLKAGESATCTITNARRGTPTAVLTLVKRCQPARDSGRFVLDIDEQEFHGLRCGQSTGPITVATGTRLVGEAAVPPTIGDNYKTEFGGNCAASGTITLAANQRATCTVTNIRVRHRPAPPPPNICHTLTASPPALQVGRRGSVAARVALRGTPVGDVLVRLSGAGISRSGRTRANGMARFAVVPTAPGTISVSTPRQFECPPAKVSHIAVRSLGAPTFTG